MRHSGRGRKLKTGQVDSVAAMHPATFENFIAYHVTNAFIFGVIVIVVRSLLLLNLLTPYPVPVHWVLVEFGGGTAGRDRPPTQIGGETRSVKKVAASYRRIPVLYTL